MTTATSTSDLLTDEMLARFDERAPVYDRENRFFDEDFEELRGSGYLHVRRARPSSAAPGSASTSTSQLVRRLGLRRPGHRAGRQHALLLDRRRRRPAAGRRRLVPLDPRAGGRAARSSPRSTARPATTCRCCCRRRARRARRRRLGDLRPQDLRQPLAGVDLRRLPRHGHLRPGRTRRSSTASCRATPRASRSSTPGTRSACGPPRARTPCSTRRSCPTSWSRWCARPGSPAPACSRSAIFAWALHGLRRHLPRRRPSGRSTSPSSRMPQRTSIALTNSMAHHPEVQHNVAEMRIAYDAAEALLERTAPTGPTGVEHADWPVRLVATRSVRDQPGLSTSSTGRSTCPAAPARSSATGSSSSSATCAWAASTPATRCWPTSSSASSASASTPTTRSAGADQGFGWASMKAMACSLNVGARSKSWPPPGWAHSSAAPRPAPRVGRHGRRSPAHHQVVARRREAPGVVEQPLAGSPT